MLVFVLYACLAKFEAQYELSYILDRIKSSDLESFVPIICLSDIYFRFL